MVGNLKFNIGYWFRIIVWNEVGVLELFEFLNKVFIG